MSAQVIPFPKAKQPENVGVDPLQQALASMENRLGVSYSDYLGLTGNPDESEMIVARNMERETLKIRTQQIYRT
ncbi:MAG: hypothetical protein ACQEXV_22210 [Bacillota bacterium]